MKLPHLDRHIAVCGAHDVPAFTKRDPGFWHIVSILSPEQGAPPYRGSRDVHRSVFHDVEDAGVATKTGVRPATADDLARILAFVDERPAEPILIHCFAGISRSTAVALTLILRAHHLAEGRIDARAAVDHLLLVRPQAVPNVLVLRLGLSTFLPPHVADRIADDASTHPTLIENRFTNPLRQ